MRKTWGGGRVTAGLVAALAAVIWISTPNLAAAQSASPEETATRVQAIDLTGAPARGPADSKVTLVMFTDFGSPAHGSTGVILQGLLDIYPERLRVVFKHNLLADRPDRMLAHEAARAAGEQGQFWAMHDLLLANQPSQSRADLVGMASQLQLDVARFAADLDSGRYRAAIEADRQQAIALGIRNQPTWFLNGARLKGPLTLVELQRLVDAAEK